MKINILFLLTVIAIFSTAILIGRDGGISKEMTYEVLSYEEAPDFVKDRIEEAGIIETSTMHINLREEHYIVITPPEGKSAEVLYVGEDESMGYGVMYKYNYKDEASEDILNNLKIIKISNYSGRISGALVND